VADRNADDVANLLDRIAEEIDHVTEIDLADVGHAAIAVIEERTKKGLDANLQPFAPYTPEYALERARQGLSTTPDLKRTGKMLDAMAPVVVGGAVKIEFADQKEATIAGANNDGVDTSAPREGKKSKRRVTPTRGKTPKREFAVIRAQSELHAVGEAIVELVAERVDQKLK